VFATQGIESRKKGSSPRKRWPRSPRAKLTRPKDKTSSPNPKQNEKKSGSMNRKPGNISTFIPKIQGLRLNLTFPPRRPVKAKDLTLEVYDREFFVDFSFAEKDPVKLVGAPAHCKLSIGRPQEMGAALTQQLSQLGADQRDPSLTIGTEFANKIAVKCP